MYEVEIHCMLFIGPVTYEADMLFIGPVLYEAEAYVVSDFPNGS